MDLVISVLSGAFLFSGAFFVLAAGVGVLRLPDVFSRLHAAGMKDTMGSALTLIGLMFLGGLSLVTVKLILIWILLWFTCSVATHSVARAAFLGGVRPVLAGHQNEAAAAPSPPQSAVNGLDSPEMEPSD
jgi:multicomponent Na+:H+ antiporter subunit G